jgi:sn-glycerol 3-phosphate transport system substrate-binding protein
MNRRAFVVASLLLAACGSGRSILEAGDRPPVATRPTLATLAPGDTLAPGQTLPALETTLAPTTTAALLDSLPDCPTTALAAAAGRVELNFWHGMQGPLGVDLQTLADQYNAGQSKVHVTLVQESYERTIDKYLQASQKNRPDLVQMPEYMVQTMVDSKSVVPVEACMKASNFDTSAFLPTGLGAYATQSVQWSMPFNISNPVLFYNKKMFVAAGLDPDKPPVSLEELRADSEAIVKSGAAKYGLALDSGFDSGGGWYIEQWFAKAGEFYADNQNGRAARATKVLYDNATGVSLLTDIQQMISDGLAVSVGDNSTTGFDNLLKLADNTEPAAMTIATSASLGPVLDVLAGGQFPQIGADDVGIGVMPGPGGKPGALVGGASLWVVDTGDDVKTAAAWDFVSFVTQAEQQSQWAAATGYVPVRTDALGIDPLKTRLAKDPRFAVAYTQLRTVTANQVAAIFDGADVATSLSAAAQQANVLIDSYNARTG